MSQRESRGASGSIELNYLWTETSNSHLETETSISLSALNDSELVLIKKYKKTNFFKASAGDSSLSKYRISVEALIELIEKHGERT